MYEIQEATLKATKLQDFIRTISLKNRTNHKNANLSIKLHSCPYSFLILK